MQLLVPDWARPSALASHRLDEATAVRLALDLAERNIESGDGGPFGAVIFEQDSGCLVSAGVNLVVAANQTVLHAEVVAIMLAQEKLGRYDALKGGHTLACSAHPCVMCLGAVHWAGLSKIVYSAGVSVTEGIGFDEGPGVRSAVAGLQKRGVVLRGGYEEERGRSILQRYRDQGGTIY